MQGSGRKYKRWRVASLVEVHHARFLLRPFALEFFMADRANALLSFPSSQAPIAPPMHTWDAQKTCLAKQIIVDLLT